MRPNPLNTGASSSRTARAAANPETTAPIKNDPQHVELAKAAQGKSPYIPYHPDMARKQAGHDSPHSLAYGQMGSGSDSTELLLPRAPERAAKSGINTTEDIPMRDLTPKGKAKRRETPVDPSIRSVTKGGYAPLNARERLAEIPLTPADSRRTSIDSSDPYGLPLPVTTGKGKQKANAGAGDRTYRQQINEEEKGIQKKSKAAGIAAAATLGAITIGGATVSTLKSMGKL